MDILIGAFDAFSKTVPVTFKLGELEHKRNVNAVLNERGEFDEEGTNARIAEVERGVAVKMAVGAISAPPEAPVVAED